MGGFGEEKRGWDVLMVDASGVVGKVSKWGGGKRRKKRKKMQLGLRCLLGLGCFGLGVIQMGLK